MMILFDFDWSGTVEELERYTTAMKEFIGDTKGVKFLGRFSPWNKKYNYTFFMEAIDLITWLEVRKKVGSSRDSRIARARDVMPHAEYEFYD